MSRQWTTMPRRSEPMAHPRHFGTSLAVVAAVVLGFDLASRPLGGALLALFIAALAIATVRRTLYATVALALGLSCLTLLLSMNG